MASRWPRSTRCATSLATPSTPASTACGSRTPTPSTRSSRWPPPADVSTGLGEVGTSRRPAVRPPPDRAGPARPHGPERARRPLHARHRRGVARVRWRRAWAWLVGPAAALHPGVHRRAAAAARRCSSPMSTATQVTTHAELNITAADTPILLAALGPKMLELAGRPGPGHHASGSAARARSPPTSRRRLRAAADDAGRPAPRIMALIRICVTDDRRRRLRPGHGDGDPLPDRCRPTSGCRTWRASTIRPSCT